MFVIELVIGWVVEGELCVLFVFDGLEGEWLDVVFVWLFGVLCICVVDFVVKSECVYMLLKCVFKEWMVDKVYYVFV